MLVWREVSAMHSTRAIADMRTWMLTAVTVVTALTLADLLSRRALLNTMCPYTGQFLNLATRFGETVCRTAFA